MTNISDKDKDKIIEDYLNGIPVADTAKEVGRSKSGIYKIINEAGYTKEDFGRNQPAYTITDEDKKAKLAPRPKLDDTNNLYDLFQALGVEDNINMQLYYCLRTLSKEAGLNAGDYIKEIVFPLMLKTLRNGLRPNSDTIEDFLQRAKKPEDKLHDLYINQAIDDFNKANKEAEEIAPEKLTPEEEARLLELKMRKHLRDKEKKQRQKLYQIMTIFPKDRWMEKLIEIVCMDNDLDLIEQIKTAFELLKKGHI